MIKAIFFDNDGVLVDTEHLYYEATRTVLAEVGAEVSEAQFIDLSLRQGRSVFDLISDRLDPPAIEDLRRRRNARYTTLLAAGVPPLDGIADVLAALQTRARLAVVTSSNPEHFDVIHAGTGLLRFFEFAITNRDYARSKPHPDPYLTALARAAGMRCIVVPRGLTRGGQFEGALRVLADTRQIVTAVDELL